MKKLTLLVLLAAQIVLPLSPAEAACTSSSTSGSVKVGSAISGGSVVICASTSSANTATAAKTKMVAVPAKKVVAPVKVVAPPPCVIQVPAAAMVYGMSISGCTIVVAAPIKVVAAKPKATTTTTTATNVTAQSDQAAFTPNPIGISSSASSGSVGQAFIFGAISGAHTRSGTILGKSAQVNFTPVSYDWSSDDGGSGSGSSFSASWGSEGAHSVSLSVGYAVSYSIGAGWIDAGVIASSASVSVTVSAAAIPVAVKAGPPLLVSGNCKVRPGSYRC